MPILLLFIKEKKLNKNKQKSYETLLKMQDRSRESCDTVKNASVQITVLRNNLAGKLGLSYGADIEKKNFDLYRFS